LLASLLLLDDPPMPSSMSTRSGILRRLISLVAPLYLQGMIINYEGAIGSIKCDDDDERRSSSPEE
jgi:hypothetical protein